MRKKNRILSFCLTVIYLCSLVFVPGVNVQAGNNQSVGRQSQPDPAVTGPLAPQAGNPIRISQFFGNAPLAVSTTLVINEVDYDQIGTDTAEFLEIKNISATSINLDLYTVEFVNGNLGGAAVYRTLDLPNYDLPAGDYYVICANAATVINCDLDGTPNTDYIQNGAPDALAIRLSGTLVDAVSYEGNSGAPYTEGSGVGLEDAPSDPPKSISRCMDGTDTDQNNVDFQYVAITPGAANSCSLTIKKNAPASVLVNEAFTYTLSVDNALGINLTGVIITDSLPTGVTFLDASDSGELLAGNVISWTVPTLANDASVSRTVSVQAPGTVGTLTNSDYGVWASEWLTRSVGSPVTTTVKLPPTMSISKTALAAVYASQPLTYTLTVTNSLEVAATNLVITDSLPLSAAFSSASDGGVQLPGNVVSWTVASLASGASITRMVTVTAPSTATVLTNADFGAWATEWLTRTVGSPVNTTVIFITPIADARAVGDGWIGTVRGNVTVPRGMISSSTSRSFNIQDSTGGIYVYPSSSSPTIALGDLVEVSGTIDNYNGLLEISPVTSVTRLGPGAPPAAVITDTAAVGSNQGKLVQVTGTATWSGSPPTPGASNFSLTITDDSGPIVVYVYKTTGIDMRSFASGDTIQITGLSYNFNGTPQIIPRYQSDIVDPPPAVKSTVPTDDAIGVSLYYPLSATFNKPMVSATISPTSFILSDTAGLVSGAVAYNATTKTASFTPAAALSPNTIYTATLTTAIKDTHNTFLLAPYTWSFTTGTADTTPPTITGQLPAPAATDVSLSANVVITFSEDLSSSSLDSSNFVLRSPYAVVPAAFSYNSTSFVVTLDPNTALLPSTFYTVTVKGTVADWAGLTLGADVVWSFETSVAPPMQVFLGDLHNHTSNSDGAGTPAQALAAGKAAGFDFMAITDHSYAISDPEWLDTLAAVNAATDANFLALRGFEYTQGAEGHINVYNTDRHAVRTNTGCSYCDFTPNLEPGSTVKGFYQWLAITGTHSIDSAGTVMQFNHPGWINFNDWAYHPEVSSVARLEEVGNGNGTSYMFSEPEYIRSLDYGWKVGATNNADTHTTYWGVNTEHRTGVLMPTLTKDALLEALRERRTYATEDKNFSLSMKANGLWMGSEIDNTGQIQFVIDGSDPDSSDLTSLVQLITDQGKVVQQYQPGTAGFTWQPLIHITTGVHYFYVKVTQADGQRIVSSPVWTIGNEDISITDIKIQPTIPTIYNASLLTVRVTNRVAASRTVTVTLDVNDTPIGTSEVVTATANGDAYATFSWQPTVTGTVTVTASLEGAPAGDNPDDNSASLNLTVTDDKLPLILIDAGKGNLNATGSEFNMFIDDLSAHGYNVLRNLDELTATDLVTDVVKLLIITAPETAYSPAELQAISEFVADGGSVWLCGMSDYIGSVSWANTVSVRLNAILDAIETRTGSAINMRINNDEVIDGDDNNGYVFGVRWSNFPSAITGTVTTGIGVNVENMTSWSLNSLTGHSTSEPLTSSTPGVQIVVQGDLDPGYSGSYHDPNHTSNMDANGLIPAYIYNPSWVYPSDPPANPIPVPIAAVTQLPNGAGRVMLYGDSSDAFTSFAYTAGDGLQNELFNLETVMWLLGQPLTKSTIAEARAGGNNPVNLGRLVWVEGEITAAYGEFFNCLYVQDETGGITVHAPAGDIDPSQYTRGTKVRVVGTVDSYNGDTEIQFFEAEMVQVISPSTGEVAPLPFTTYQASLEANQGWLGVITGTVMAKIGNDTLLVDDGSGPVRVFLDGYNGNFDGIDVFDRVRVTGLLSEDGDGSRIRVRNYILHPEYADDVVELLISYYMPIIIYKMTP